MINTLISTEDGSLSTMMLRLILYNAIRGNRQVILDVKILHERSVALFYSTTLETSTISSGLDRMSFMKILLKRKSLALLVRMFSQTRKWLSLRKRA